MTTPVRLRDDASCPLELIEALRAARRAAPSAEQVHDMGQAIQARALEPERLLEADQAPEPLQQALAELGGWGPLPAERARITERLAKARGLSKPTRQRRACRPRLSARFAAVGLALLASSAAAAVGWMAIEHTPTGIAPPEGLHSSERQVDEGARHRRPTPAPIEIQPPASLQTVPTPPLDDRLAPSPIPDSASMVEPYYPDQSTKPRSNRDQSDAKSHRGGAIPAPAAAPAAPDPLGELKVVREMRHTLRTDPVRVLTLAQEHRRKFANGVLAQERDVLLLEALARLNRGAELQREAQRFQRLYPGSPHLRRVEALMR